MTVLPRACPERERLTAAGASARGISALIVTRSFPARLNRRLDRQLKEDAGITHLQYEILARLSGAPDREMRMGELVDALSNSKSGLMYQITQLEKAGLVRRRWCPSDVRAVYAVLTDDGRRLLEEAAPGHVALVRELLIDVLTPEQLGALADGLGEVARRMQGEEVAPVRR